MTKGERTRKDILEQAYLLAADNGLEGVTLGALAAQTGMSKSGLFAHFKSKEALQLGLLEEIEQRFIVAVIKPTIREPRGEPRLRALVALRLHWIMNNHPKGGCPFMALAYEYDDRPGPLRDRLVQAQNGWYDTIKRVAQTGVDQGHFRADLDIDLFAFEFLGVEMAFQHAAKLLASPEAERLARAAFEGLIERSRSVSFGDAGHPPRVWPT